MERKTCIHCGKSFDGNPRVKKQMYCNGSECQKARRARWQRGKMGSDPDYRDNQRHCHKEWISKHPDYYRNYRVKHPEYTERNRVLQLKRNARQRKDVSVKLIAKMDSLTGLYPSCRETFKLIPQDGRLIAKMDSLIVKLIPMRRLATQYG